MTRSISTCCYWGLINHPHFTPDSIYSCIFLPVSGLSSMTKSAAMAGNWRLLSFFGC
ncbi:hypothetical protein M595_5873 [Lyngbya aestuarii BL J]|uniref:Uncharacterized protein n=1 Tax=Lyngbya aestuarii BL J TaxID=1348334 RepID=U7QAV9_9CYAN|nr:hypothetical protein M595_5873 [Lyngbya aestuarii BL J]